MDRQVTYDHIPSLPADAAGLSVRQRNAIDLLAQGQSDREVGEAVGVARETVTRWRNGHAAFQAELNSVRRRVWQGSQDHLTSLVHEAIDTLAGAMRAGDVRAAVAIIKTSGLPEAIREPDGEEDAARILWMRAMGRAQEERALEHESETALAGDDLPRFVGDAERAQARIELRRRAGEIFDALCAGQSADARE